MPLVGLRPRGKYRVTSRSDTGVRVAGHPSLLWPAIPSCIWAWATTIGDYGIRPGPARRAGPSTHCGALLHEASVTEGHHVCKAGRFPFRKSRGESCGAKAPNRSSNKARLGRVMEAVSHASSPSCASLPVRSVVLLALQSVADQLSRRARMIPFTRR